MDQPDSVRALQELADLYEEDLSPSQPELDQGQDPLQLFLAGRAAMWIGSGRWAAYDLRDAGNVDWAIAPKPAGSDGHPRANFFHLSLYAIASSSDSPENAWEFLKFMVSPGGIELGLQNMQGIPSREKVARSPEITDDPFVKQHDAYEPFTWQPGYDFELRAWEVSDGSVGLANFHLVTPHPDETPPA